MLKITNNRDNFYQWDVGQSLTAELAEGEELTEVHIGNEGCDKFYVVEPINGIIAVYDELLQISKKIIAYEYIKDGEDGHTIRKYSFNVFARPKATDYEYTPTQSYSWEYWSERARLYAESAADEVATIPAKMAEWWDINKPAIVEEIKTEIPPYDDTEIKAEISGIQQELNDKMEFYKLDTQVSGSNVTFYHDGVQLDFEAISDKYFDDKYFLYAECLGLTFIPCFPPTETDQAIEFISTYIYGGEVMVDRLIINSENKGKFEEKYVAEKSEVNEIREDVSRVSESLNQKADKTELALANRKINALTNILEGRELAFDTQKYNENPVAVPSGAVADTLMMIGGKSLVWNHYGGDNYLVESGATVIKSGEEFIFSNTVDTASIVYSFPINPNQKYYLTMTLYGQYTFVFSLGVSIQVKSNEGVWTKNTGIVVPSAYRGQAYIYPNTDANAKVSNVRIKDINIFNLTQMFGAGNEPTTVDDPRIKAIEQYAEAHPEYNTGEIISSQTDEVVVRGANLWDEEWESGIITWDGTNYPDNTRIRSKNFIPCESEKTYFCFGNKIQLFYYDANKSFIGYQQSSKTNNPFTTPVGTKYVKFFTYGTDYGNVYKNDIAIINGAAGTYKPYSLTAYPTNLPEMKSAGTAHDEVEYNVTFKNMKSVDLGSLDWAVGDAVGKFYRTNFSDTARVTLCESYPYSKETWVKGCCGIANTGALWVYDDSYTTASEFKSAMSGVILHYEATEGGEDYTTNVLHERVGSFTFNGTEDWEKIIMGLYNCYRVRFDPIAPRMNAQMLSVEYSMLENVWSLKDKSVRNYNGNYRNLEFFDNNISSVGEWTSKLNASPLVFYYELATERIKELPNLPSLEAINVESGGEIRFVDHSEVALPIPSTHEFIVRNDEV